MKVHKQAVENSFLNYVHNPEIDEPDIDSEFSLSLHCGFH